MVLDCIKIQCHYTGVQPESVMRYTKIVVDITETRATHLAVWWNKHLMQLTKKAYVYKFFFMMDGEGHDVTYTHIFI